MCVCVCVCVCVIHMAIHRYILAYIYTLLSYTYRKCGSAFIHLCIYPEHPSSDLRYRPPAHSSPLESSTDLNPPGGKNITPKLAIDVRGGGAGLILSTKAVVPPVNWRPPNFGGILARAVCRKVIAGVVSS